MPAGLLYLNSGHGLKLGTFFGNTVLSLCYHLSCLSLGTAWLPLRSTGHTSGVTSTAVTAAGTQQDVFNKSVVNVRLIGSQIYVDLKRLSMMTVRGPRLCLRGACVRELRAIARAHVHSSYDLSTDLTALVVWSRGARPVTSNGQLEDAGGA